MREETLARIESRLLAAPARAGGTRVLAIDGRSGSGKTRLGTELAARLEGAALVQLDQLYPGWDGLAASVPLLVGGVLAPLSEGLPAGFERWDWQAGRPGPWQPVPAAAVLVVEGAGSGSRACTRYLSMLVWLRAPAPFRHRRAMSRDGDSYAPHWRRWADQEDRLFAAEGTRARADLVIDTG